MHSIILMENKELKIYLTFTCLPRIPWSLSLSVCLRVAIYLSVWLLRSVPPCIKFSTSACVPLSLSPNCLYLYLFVIVSLTLSVPVYISVCISVCLSLSLSFSFSLIHSSLSYFCRFLTMSSSIYVHFKY